MSDFAHRERTAPGAVASDVTPRAPGKHTRTQELPARSTGVPFVDDGTACERGTGDECYLTGDQRTRMAVVIANRGGIVGANSRDGLQDSRIDELIETPEGLGALFEFVFYSTTGPIIGMVASRIVNEAVRENVKAFMLNVSRAQRKQLQGMAMAPAPGKSSRVFFLQLCRDSIGPWQAALLEEAPRDLDDDGLTALKDALDPSVLTVDFFKGRIADMLSRYDKQQIDQIGVQAIYRHGEVMWIGRGKRRRLILLEDYGLHNLSGANTPKPRDLVAKLARDGKPIVVDDDLVPMALAFYAARTGRQPFDMDPEDAVAAGGELARIGNDLLVEILTLGGAL